MILFDEKRIERTIKRMSYQILEEIRNSPVHLAGINERGYLVARKIKSVLENIAPGPFPLSRVMADDLSGFEFESPVSDNDILILIDDVIFSGKTMYNATEKIGELTRFKKVLVVVLIDRGHRNIPIQAEIVGKYVPTKLNELIELVINDEKLEKITLTKQYQTKK